MKSEPSLNNTDLCVMCGMCTPHCPTFHIYKTEAESPRGRIALMQALDKGLIEAGDKVVEHLNHCLSCMACERICPSQVPFGQLIDSARQQFTSTKQSRLQKQLLKLSAHKQGVDYYQQHLSLLNRSGLTRLLPKKSKIRSIVEQSQSIQLDSFYPARGHKKGNIGFFKGCVGQTFDANTLVDAISLITHLGFDVHIPEDQFCCGALHQHNGDMPTAQKLAEQNQLLFSQYDFDAIIYSSSGCGSQIMHTGFSAPVVDLVSFLLEQLSSHSLEFKPLNKTVVIHQGCRGKNELGLDHTNQQLMEYIPDITILPLLQKDLCCGAGGSNHLDYPELSSQLLSLKLNEIKSTQTDYLVSENLGCSLHFKTGIEHSHLMIEVLHPVTLLARQLI